MAELTACNRVALHTKFFFWGNPDANYQKLPTQDKGTAAADAPEPRSLAYAKRITTVAGGLLAVGSLAIGEIMHWGYLTGFAAAVKTALPAFILFNALNPAAAAFYALAVTITLAATLALGIMAIVNAVRATKFDTSYDALATTPSMKGYSVV